MTTDSRGGNAATLLTFAAGAATGALLLALASPRAGARLRCAAEELGRDVRRGAGEAWEEVKDRVEDLRD